MAWLWFVGRVVSPAAWGREIHRRKSRWRARRLRKQVEALYRTLPAVTIGSGTNAAVVADGLWDNPNHFFRLRLFLEALPGAEAMTLVAVLRTERDRTRRTLEDLGFRNFVTLDDHPRHRREDFLPVARRMLAQVKTHADLLALSLPNGLPAYTYYDTVLKLARHPQPPLDDPLWTETLAAVLRYDAIYIELLQTWRPAHVVLSHPWKSEYAGLIWRAVSAGIPAYHLTGYCEGVRVRRFLDRNDYQLPVEHLTRKQFEAMGDKVRWGLIEEGRRYLHAREAGEGTDINARMAYRPDLRVDRSEACRRLGLSGTRPVVMIYSHVWYDFPHTFAMAHFTDFLDWMQVTLSEIGTLTHVDWLLKPHPTEQWYGGFQLNSLAADLPAHVHLLPLEVDSLTMLDAADAIVTVHGTVALEAAAHGRVVIGADRSYYSDWGISHQASNRQNYRDLLSRVDHLAPPDEAAQERALALIALALAPTPLEAGSMRIRCDSTGPDLYTDILRQMRGGAPALEAEKRHLSRWIEGAERSYSIQVKIDYFEERAGNVC